MEPVFMVMAQSTAVAAALAINKKIPVQKVDVKEIQAILKANPLADGSKPDILVDNDDVKHVTQIGLWKRNSETKNGYASSFLQSDNQSSLSASVKFSPSIPGAGRYKAYTYIPKIAGASSTLAVIVFDGKKANHQVINQKTIKVKGQTSGEWAYLGAYHFAAGNKNYISITNINADGYVIADAVLLVPERD
jgi:hypothetical protein